MAQLYAADKMNYADCVSSEASESCLMSTCAVSPRNMNGLCVYHVLGHKGASKTGGLLPAFEKKVKHKN